MCEPYSMLPSSKKVMAGTVRMRMTCASAWRTKPAFSRSAANTCFFCLGRDAVDAHIYLRRLEVGRDVRLRDAHKPRDAGIAVFEFARDDGGDLLLQFAVQSVRSFCHRISYVHEFSHTKACLGGAPLATVRRSQAARRVRSAATTSVRKKKCEPLYAFGSSSMT